MIPSQKQPGILRNYTHIGQFCSLSMQGVVYASLDGCPSKTNLYHSMSSVFFLEIWAGVYILQLKIAHIFFNLTPVFINSI